MSQTDRAHLLNDAEPDPAGKYVLYWMQMAQRTVHNDALELAITKANQADLPLIVCFGMMDDYPEANERHYAFMLEGLRDVDAALKGRDIKFVIKHGLPPEVCLHYAKDATEVVVDQYYTRPPMHWYPMVADKVGKRFTQVETEVVVPVDLVSDKHEYAARTIRPKIHRHWNDFLKPLKAAKVNRSSLRLHVEGDYDASQPQEILQSLKLDRSVKRSPLFNGGQDAADKLFKAFIRNKLPDYADGRNEPSEDRHSYMSMYLHFGQISPVHLALAAQKSNAGKKNIDSFLEELIVRRELSKNFTHHCHDYDQYSCLPNWAKQTLAEHRHDKRDYLYTREQLENAQTHDQYWNAAMRQKTLTGFMHNYMRMYWGKKIIEWTHTPEYAFETTLYLNNKYLIDGRDSNSFANVAWLFGLHDRPWTERKIFGKTRYMNAAGLERKFDIDKYVQQIDELERGLLPGD